MSFRNYQLSAMAMLLITYFIIPSIARVKHQDIDYITDTRFNAMVLDPQ